jgi:hypothetical protein
MLSVPVRHVFVHTYSSVVFLVQGNTGHHIILRNQRFKL